MLTRAQQRKKRDGNSRKNNFYGDKSPSQIREEFKSFIIDKQHPCLAAQSVFHNESYELFVLEQLGSKSAALQMSKHIKSFIENKDQMNGRFVSLICCFKNPQDLSEMQFESLLWQQLQFLNAIDECSWDETVSDNPEDSKFSFSFDGTAFYVVGLQANSSRLSRQFNYPTLVFNLHTQFEALREKGNYSKMRDGIRARDTQLQGFVNPMMEDHGVSSEAKQYSGREVDESWKCPFLNQNSK